MAKKQLTIEEKLQAALVPVEEQPYKVPENWCWSYINAWFDVTSSKRVHKEDWLDDGIPFIRTRELVKLSDNGYVDNELFISAELYDKYKEEFGVPKADDILVSGVGTIGVPYVVQGTKPFYFKDGNVLWLKNKGNVNADFVYWLYKSMFMYNQLHEMSAGTTVDTYTIVNSKKTKLPIPPYKEQSRIVARIESLFAKLDEAKEKIQEVLDGADLRRAAILHQAFTGKLTEKWRRENGVSDDSWEDKSIREIAVPRAGVAFDSKKFSTKGYQVIRMGNLYNGELDLSRNPVYYPQEFLDNKILERALIHNDDILITLTGTKYKRDYGYAVKMVNPEKLLVNQRILCLTAIKEYMLSDYLNYYLQTKLFRDVFFSNETGGVNQGNVSSKFVESIVIKVPLVDEQQEIVRLLDNLLSREQAMVTACEEALTTIDTLKKSILARAFRGELGTNDPSEASAKELLQEILAS